MNHDMLFEMHNHNYKMNKCTLYKYESNKIPGITNKLKRQINKQTSKQARKYIKLSSQPDIQPVKRSDTEQNEITHCSTSITLIRFE